MSNEQEQQDETAGFVVEDGSLPDQQQPAEAPEAEKPAAEAAEGGEAEAKGDDGAKADDEEGRLPEWVRKRLAREKRKVSDAARERDEFAEKYETAKGMIEQLRRQRNGGLDPNDFETVAEYQAAKKAMDEGERKLSARPNADLAEAIADLREAADSVDGKLWQRLAEIPAEEAFLGEQMVMAMADLDEAAPAAMRAWLDLTPEDREDVANMPPRARRRALRALAAEAPKPKKAEPEPEAKAEPERDASGKFVKRQSSAPAPIDPVRGTGTGEVPLDKASYADFEARRNAEDKRRGLSMW
ncbi:hypothetical protein [Amaricoccus solimangrovi]|uniref:Uncharacterized protein n=1 Tax=Amaricoccus solimangrovi TaxID=2589815 RepID=A0A501WWH3_9RHOB|nr:hypothetical protein [Amaricoccus solimangrovi]TPE53072.1 hypothetical protein FJM51_03345 [Amaricoccus solimangrovi]